jgi:hypothetical protein
MKRLVNGLILAGIVLFLLGAAGLAIPAFSTQQTHDVAWLGDLKLQATESTPHEIPPLLSGGVLALGIILIGAGLTHRT